MKILIVYNSKSSEPTAYANAVDVDLKTEIRAACDNLALVADAEKLAVIERDLVNGIPHWFAEDDGEATYCFDLIQAD